MSRASLKPAMQNGTSPAQTIRASGPRPHQQAEHKTASDPIANISRPLAMREPSTQDVRFSAENYVRELVGRGTWEGLRCAPRHSHGGLMMGGHACCGREPVDIDQLPRPPLREPRYAYGVLGGRQLVAYPSARGQPCSSALDCSFARSDSSILRRGPT